MDHCDITQEIDVWLILYTLRQWPSNKNKAQPIYFKLPNFLAFLNLYVVLRWFWSYKAKISLFNTYRHTINQFSYVVRQLTTPKERVQCPSGGATGRRATSID